MAIQPTRIVSPDFATGVNNLLEAYRVSQRDIQQREQIERLAQQREQAAVQRQSNADRLFERLLSRDEVADNRDARDFGLRKEQLAETNRRADAGLDLRRQQIAATRANVAASNRRADASLALQRERFDFNKKAKMFEMDLKREAKAAPGAKFDPEQKLRREYQGLTKDFRQIRDAYTRIEASAKDPSAAGDLALIFSYMRILDPSSTVREGEFATAQNAAGVPQRVMNIYNQVLSGERLGDTQRKDFVGRARQLFGGRRKQYAKTSGEFEQLALRNGLNPENVVLDLGVPTGGQGGQPRLRFNPETGDFDQ